MSRAVRRAELVAGILLLYFALVVNPAQHPLLFALFVVEALAAFYLSVRFGKRGHARAVAIILSLAILLPILIRVLRGALSARPAGPAVLLSFILVGLVGASQLLALMGALVERSDVAPSA